uniref:Uncharacterized protein n=1 Tax=Helianthus annuus TaxID=4232 RepID=A0A251T1K1_HELAN
MRNQSDDGCVLHFCDNRSCFFAALMTINGDGVDEGRHHGDVGGQLETLSQT